MPYCVVKDRLDFCFAIDEKFIADYETRGHILVSRHDSISDVQKALAQCQLDDSRRVREDASAIDGKTLLAKLIAVDVNWEQGTRRSLLHLVTPSGGTMIQMAKINSVGSLASALNGIVNLNKPGMTFLPSPIPVTLHLFDNIVRRDAQVADWRVVDVRQQLMLAPDQLRQCDVLVIEQQHWLTCAFVTNGVIATRFTGSYRALRPEAQTTFLPLTPGTLYTVERAVGCPPAFRVHPARRQQLADQVAQHAST